MLPATERELIRKPYETSDFPKGDNRPLEQLYRAIYRPYLAWAVTRWKMEQSDLEEALNEAIILFRRKAWDGSLSSYVGKQLNTIVFAFAANLLRNRMRHNQKQAARFVEMDQEIADIQTESAAETEALPEDELFSPEAEGKVARLKAGFAQLTERCRNILLMRIVHQMPMPEIAEQMGLSSVNSAKTAKNKCLNRLKQLLDL